MAAPLRAVGEGEVPVSSPPLTILQAVEAGDRLAELRAVHRRIARAVDSERTSPRDLAALTRRQIELSREIEALEKQLKEDEVGDHGPTADEAWDAEAI